MNITIKVEADELVQAIIQLTESMKPSVTAEPKAKRVKTEAPAPIEPAPTPEVVEAPAPAPATNVTLVQVRARLAELSSEGKKEAIKKLMADLGVSKLTEVKEEQYAELMSAAEAL
jgi:hypothetical protein